MKYIILIILVVSSFCYGQDDKNQTPIYNSFSLGYGQSANKLNSDFRLNNFAYTIKMDSIEYQFIYNLLISRHKGSSLNRYGNVFVIQFGIDYKYFGYKLGLKWLNHDFASRNPYRLLIPIVGEIKVGNLSNYYFSIHIFNQQDFPAASLNLTFLLNNQNDFIRFGAHDGFRTIGLNLLFQKSFSDFILFRINSLSYLKSNDHFFYGSIGIYYDL